MPADPIHLELLRVELGGRTVVHQAAEQVSRHNPLADPASWLRFCWGDACAWIARREDQRVGNTYA